MDNVNEFFYKSHYNIIRILLSLNGLWPFHSIGRRYLMYFVVFSAVGSGVILEIASVVEALYNGTQLIEYMPVLFLLIVLLIKFICMIHTLPKIKIILLKMYEYYHSSRSDEEIKIVISHAMHGRKLSYIYAGLMYSHSIGYLVSTLLTKFSYMESSDNVGPNKAQEALPYHVLAKLDGYYFLAYAYTLINEVIDVTLLMTCDILYLTLIEYSCGLFAALRYRLENAFKLENNDVSSSTIPMKDSYSNLMYSVQRHTEAIQFVQLIESIYTLPLFIYLGIIVLLISAVGYELMTDTEDMNHVGQYVSYLSSLFLNLLFQGWQGQKIINSSEKMLEYAYNAEWYNMPIAHRKIILMIMLRSKTPLVITAGKILEMSYITCNAVLRTSSSYFMLLRSL